MADVAQLQQEVETLRGEYIKKALELASAAPNSVHTTAQWLSIEARELIARAAREHWQMKTGGPRETYPTIP